MKSYQVPTILCSIIILVSCQRMKKDRLVLEDLPDKSDLPKNVVFILSDDHRYDFMGFTGKVPHLETPHMDKMAREGAHLQNAFVTTSLCSPSRASILTGQFSHHHGVVDNQSLVPDSVIFFPQYLQKTGYNTGFVGKWHMGEHHSGARPGFDYWVSFRGQGVYYNPTLNINGFEKSFKDSAYMTDLLSQYALEFLDRQGGKQPFFLYLSHKGVHSEFYPAERHLDRYEDKSPSYPKTMFPDKVASNEYNYAEVPEWVKKQRYSWHGVDYMYHGAYDFDQFYQRYTETLLSVDESVGLVLQKLEENDLMKNTIVFYMGDNGFSFGEHGLIDKRQAFEESIRVPLLAYGAGVNSAMHITEMVQNIDIGPTILELAGLKTPKNMDGSSFLPILQGEEISWRDRIYYEYFWERPFPQTPTVHAVRTEKYKYIRYHGIWDNNELYDLENDPEETNNLIRSPQHQELAKALNADLWDWLYQTDGLSIPLRRDYGRKIDHKYKGTY
ncbi:MAG: sulfatase [Cyclobacteriaceae bacterium]|nr:sulfatase [Cyclobacteriaceae bacterium HetDA_MAG_MS6]